MILKIIDVKVVGGYKVPHPRGVPRSGYPPWGDLGTPPGGVPGPGTMGGLDLSSQFVTNIIDPGTPPGGVPGPGYYRDIG